jgi:hypothetical protein
MAPDEGSAGGLKRQGFQQENMKLMKNMKRKNSCSSFRSCLPVGILSGLGLF